MKVLSHTQQFHSVWYNLLKLEFKVYFYFNSSNYISTLTTSLHVKRKVLISNLKLVLEKAIFMKYDILNVRS